MALDAAQSSKVHQIFGLPETGVSFAAFQTATIFGPAGESYSFTYLTTQLAALCAAASTQQTNRCTTVIDEWDSIGSTSPLEINKTADGAEGKIVDYPLQRENIRQELAKILGFYCPVGGWLAQFQSQGQNRIIR